VQEDGLIDLFVANEHKFDDRNLNHSSRKNYNIERVLAKQNRNKTK
jgi:hypothetical protein